jgi:glycosyltransferase involved in cell wall biosynthesis
MHEKVLSPERAPDPNTISAAWVVVPAYNEGTVIASTISGLLPSFDNVVVVDDCSVDSTRQLALSAGAHVVRHPVNLGQGAALATGIAYALRQGADAIVTFDADGQHSASEARAMVDLLDSEKVDVILGSRFLGAAHGISSGRRALLKLAVLFTRATTGLTLTDAHNGLRVLSRRAAGLIRIRQNRMAHASEILEQIASHRISFVEAPCTIAYTEYSKAKGQRWTGAFTILTDLLTRRLYR